MRSVLCIWDVAAGAERVVLEVAGRIEAPNWHPGGDWLLVNGDGLLYRVPLADPALHLLDTGFATRCNNDHGFSPDGSRTVLSHHTDRGAEIFMVASGGGVPQPVTRASPSWWHGWSPDGQVLAYVAARGNRVVDVYTIGVDGGDEVRLTGGEGHCDGPDFSADGRRIYYNCDRGGHAQIWVMGADGAGQRQLFADDHVNWFPHPSPCGRYLTYLAYPPGTLGHPADLPVALMLCDPDGGNRRRLVAFTGGQGTINVPSWAPDGAAFAYMRYET